MKTCEKCQGENENDAKFCGKCGQKFIIENRSISDEKTKIVLEINLKNDNQEEHKLVLHKQEGNLSNDLFCPKCGSKNIYINKKGYGAGRAFWGTVFFGPLGLLMGQTGANNVLKTCLNCNKRF